MTFVLKSDLPQKIQNEVDRILAKDAGQRNATEAAFITARTPYLTNEVIARDADNLITQAAGNTVPSAEPGFKKGALFTKKDATTNGLYQNIGDENSCNFSIVTDTDTDVNDVPSGTPVNAVAASKVLTVGGLPAEDDTVTIDGVVYTWKDTISAAVAATGVLTAAANPDNGNTVEIGNKTYTFKTALTEAAAVGTLTATNNFADSETVTIGETVYKFTVNLSAPAVVNEIKIGANASASLDNLIAAINHAAGEGTTYSTGTVAHPDVSAAAGAGDTMTVTAKVKGVAGNSIATTEACANASFGGAVLASGADAVANEILIGAGATNSLDNLIAAVMGTAGEGTTYSTGTVAHTQVSAAAGAGDTVDFEAVVAGDEGNSLASVGTGQVSFAAATLTGGEGVEEANDVLIGVSAEACIDNLVAAITGAAGEGTIYGTGTVEHPTVTAAKTNSSTMTVTAKTKGEAGNSIAIAESGGNTSWAGGATALSGGVNGTVGNAGAMKRDATYLYIAVAANSIADANWRRISVGAVY